MELSDFQEIYLNFVGSQKTTFCRNCFLLQDSAKLRGQFRKSNSNMLPGQEARTHRGPLFWAGGNDPMFFTGHVPPGVSAGVF